MTGVEYVTAATGSTLNGMASGTNQWGVTGANAGSVTNGSTSLDFTGFNILAGTDTSADQFTIASSGSFTGQLRGGADSNLQANTLTNNLGNDWVLSAANNGDVGSTSFTNIGVLNGSGSDTLTAHSQSNFWAITGANSGNINNDELIFDGFTDLTGNSGADDFVIEVTGSISGLIDGSGGGVRDSVTINSLDAITVELGALVNTNLNLVNIEDIVRPAANADISWLEHSIVDPAVTSYSWTIDGHNAGHVAPTDENIADVNNTISFTNFGNLRGSLDDDVIEFVGADGALDGTFDARGGSGVLDLRGQDRDVDITIGVDYLNVIEIIANADYDAILRAENDLDNAWFIDGEGSGTYDAGGDTTVDFTFENFDELVGGSANDTFNFVDAGNISGQIDGGLGINTINGLSAGNPASSVDLTLQLEGDFAARSNNAITSLIGISAITANPANNNTLIGANQDNTWDITSSGGGAITGGYTFSGFDVLEGNAGVDIFEINGGGITTVRGQGGSDRLIGDATPNVFQVTSDNAGSLNAISFFGIEDLQGNSERDEFYIENSATLTGRIDGQGGDNDALFADDGENTWTITSANSGDVTSIGDFVRIEQLIGGNGEDTFTFSDGARVSTVDGVGSGNRMRFVAESAVIAVDMITNTAAGVAYANIAAIDANNAHANTLQGMNADSVWQITGPNAGSVASVLAFTGFHNLDGGTEVDDFVLSGAGSVAGRIDGGASGIGGDSLTVSSGTNTWNVEADNEGNVTGIINNFLDIENLVGGTARDTFNFANGARVTTVNGGDAVVDQINFSAETSGLLANLDTGVVAGITVSNIEDIVANSANSNTLNAPNQDNIWMIDGTDSGSVNAVIFSGFDTLNGNQGVDRFFLQASGAVTGTLNGGAGEDDFLTAANRDNRWVVLSQNNGYVDGVNSFVSVEHLVGNAGNDDFVINAGGIDGDIVGGGGQNSLHANTVAANSWSITGVEEGLVNTVGGRFSEIETLIASNNGDLFLVQDLARVDEILGGTGVDTLDVRALSAPVNVNLETQIMAGVRTTSIDSVLANAVSGNTVTAANQENTWILNGADAGQINANFNFAGFAYLVGGSEADTFRLQGGTVSGRINGGGSEDTLIANADIENTFVITDDDGGNVTGVVDYQSIENLTGNNLADTFEIRGGSVSGIINGAGTSDTLIGNAEYNVWSITDVNEGVATNVVRFTDIENLTGNIDRDDFVIAGGSLLGSIDGLDGVDSLTVDADLENTVVIDTINGGTATGISGRFDGIENLNGGNQADAFSIAAGELTGLINGGLGDDSFTGANVANTFTVYALNSGAATGLGSDTADATDGFINVENLVGNAQDDSFILNGGTLAGGIDGREGMDTLFADNVANAFEVSSDNSGSATGLTTGFATVEHLVGNAQNDTFTLNGGILLGTIDGQDGVDTFNADDVANTIVLNIVDGGTATGLASGTADVNDGFANIEYINGNNEDDNFVLQGGQLSGLINGLGGMDTLQGDNLENTFIVYVNNGGTATGLGELTADTEDGFSNIEHLTGNAENDTFVLDGGVLGGLVDGGDGTDTFVGNAVDNTFTVLSDNQGTATGLGGSTLDSSDGFENIENLTGNTLNDSFYLNGGTLGGEINGGVGNDTLYADNTDNLFVVDAVNGGSATGVNNGFTNVENLVGNAQQDRFEVNGGSLVGSIDGLTNDDSLLVVSAGGQSVTWTVDEQNNGTVDGINGGFNSIENLEGSLGNDAFTIAGAALVNVNISAADGDDVFNVLSVVNGLLQGQGGNDSFNIEQDVILQSVQGGTGDDVFTLANAGVDVTVDGGDDRDTIDVAHIEDSTWTLNGLDDRVQDSVGGTARFSAVEIARGGDGIDTFNVTSAFAGSLIGEANADVFNLFSAVLDPVLGGAGDDTFYVRSEGMSAALFGEGGEDALYVTHEQANLWTINGVANQVQDASAGVVMFDGMELLVGNLRVDTFDVITPFAGRIDGQGNNDIFNLGADVDDGDELRTDVLGGAGNDIFNITALNVSATIDGGDNADQLVVAHGFDTTWVIDGLDNRVIDTAGGSAHFQSIERATGGAGVDTFQVGSAFAGRIEGGANDDVFMLGADVDDSNVLTRDVVGGAGDDIFRIAGPGLQLSLDGDLGADTLVIDHAQDVAWTIDGVNDRLSDANGALVRFAGVENALGGSAVDTFTVTSAVTGTLDGRDSGDIFNLAADVSTVVNGGFGDDVFNLNATGLVLNLDGGQGSDAVVSAHNQDANWILDGVADRVEDTAGGSTQFVSVERAQGGNGIDTYNVTRLFAGQLDGQGNNDVFNISANVADGNVLTADILGGLGDDQIHLNVAGLSVSVDGGDGQNDAVIANHSANNTWVLDGNANRVEDDFAGSTNFINIERAQGNSGVDQFIVTAPFTGSIDGQAGNDVFTFAANVSDGNLISSDILGGAGDDVFLLQASGLLLSIDGEEGTDTLTVAHTDDSLWTIDNSNNRVEDANSGDVRFTGIETNLGGSGVDVFDIVAQVDGVIDGGAGNDRFNISADVLTAVQGGLGDDAFVINATGLTLNIEGALGSDSIETAYNATNTWTINGAANSVADELGGMVNFTTIESIVGSEGIDTVNVNALYQGSIDARGNDDIFNLFAAVSDNLITTDDVLGGSGNDQFNVLATGLALAIDAGDGSDSLSAPVSDNTWVIGATNTLNNSISFASMERFIGNVQADTFVLEAGAVVTQIRGAFGTAIEVGDDTIALTHSAIDTAAWRITDENTGSVDGQIAAFDSIENLVGGEGSDTFLFTTALSDITGLINGNTSSDLNIAGSDTLRLEVLSAGVIVELGNDTSSENLHAVNVENIIAATDPLPSDANDTEALNQLVNNQAGNYQWVIDDRNAGRVEPTILLEAENSVSFENFGTLVAGQGEDTFRFEELGYISGEIIGGTGNNTADYSGSRGDITIVVGAGGISGFTTIIGNNDGSDIALPTATLQIAEGDNIWFIENTSSTDTDGVNDGQFTDGSFGTTDFTFANFNSIQGGSGEDTFIVNGAATFTGTLNGGANVVSNPDTLHTTNATYGVNVQEGGSTFGYINVSNIEEVTANLNFAASNTFFASNTDSNMWAINGTDAGILNDAVAFSGFANLVGTEGADLFVLNNDDRITGLIDGASGFNDTLDLSGLNPEDAIAVELGNRVNTAIDVLNLTNTENVIANPNARNTLFGEHINNAWRITGSDTGVIQRTENNTSETTVAFTGFSELVGGELDDVFTFDAAGAVNGVIHGGDAEGVTSFDTVNLVALAADVRVGVGASADAAVNVNGIESVIGNSDFVNTFIADAQNNQWRVDGVNRGDLNGATVFEGFANLEGRNADDVVMFTVDGQLDGYIDLAAQNADSQDRVDMSALAFVDATLGNGTTHLRNVEHVIGNGENSTLTADVLVVDQGNQWRVDDQINAGTVNNSIEFEGFNNLRGSVNDDNFTLVNGGQVSGIIDAGAGNDVLALTLVDDVAEQTFVGGEGDDLIRLTGELAGFTGEYTPQVSTTLIEDAELIVYSDATTNYGLAYTGTETVQDNVVADTLVVNGTLGANHITVNDTATSARNTLVVTVVGADAQVLETFSALNFTGKENLLVAANDADQVNIAGDLTMSGGRVEIQNASVISTDAAFEITADTLALTNVAGVGSETLALSTNVTNLAISANDDVYLSERNGVTLTALDMANAATFDLALRLAGDVDSSAALNTNGVFSVRTAMGNINLSGENTLAGTTNLAASNAITLNNTLNTRLGAVQAQSLTATIAGSLSDVDGAAIQVDDALTLSTDGGISFDNADHSFGRVTITAGGNVLLNDGDTAGLIIDNITADDGVSVSASGLQVRGQVLAQNISLDAGVGELAIDAMLSTAGAALTAGDISLSGTGIVQAADVLAQSDITIDSDAGFSMAETVSLISESAGIDLNAVGDVSLRALQAANDVGVSSTSGDVNVNEVIASAQGGIFIDALNNVSVLAMLNADTSLSVTSVAGDIAQQANIAAVQGDVVIAAGNDLIMNAETSTQVENGTVSLTAGNDLHLTRVSAGGSGDAENGQQAGLVTLDATAGGIINAAPEQVNVTANHVVMDAETGIGSDTPLTLAVNTLSAGNQAGGVRFTSDQDVTVERIHNNGDIELLVTSGDILIDNTNYGTYDIEATNANDAGGIIDGGYTSDGSGMEDSRVSLTTMTGDINVVEARPVDVSYLEPVIVGENIYINTVTGQSGSPQDGRRISFLADNDLILQGRSAARPIIAFRKELGRPINIQNLAEFQPDLASLLLASGDLLVEVESIEAVNPAVFSEVRNYSQDLVAILMPDDQRYEEDEDEYDDEY